MVDPVPGFRNAQVAEPGSYREGMPTMDGRDYVSQGCCRVEVRGRWCEQSRLASRFSTSKPTKS